MSFMRTPSSRCIHLPKVSLSKLSLHSGFCRCVQREGDVNTQGENDHLPIKERVATEETNSDGTLFLDFLPPEL